MEEERRSKKNRMIRIADGVIGPAAPRTRSVRKKVPADYATEPRAYLEVARHYSSPLLLGPPLCDQLMALVRHMYTEEEAELVRHIPPLRLRSAAEVARAAGRPVNEVRQVLDGLAGEKRLIIARGEGDGRRYCIMPIVPGTFELALIRVSEDSLTDWHREFARLFEQLWDTGFLTDYTGIPSPLVRYIPVGKSIEAHPMALPSDRLEAVLDRYDHFGVGICQCRLTEKIAGRWCGRPLENCTVMGELAESAVLAGQLKSVSKQSLIEIKREAEESGLVTWMINEESGVHSSCSCSCCGCCCHMLRTVSEYNSPGWIAPPHFMPERDPANCDYCGKCARNCPMGAITVDVKNRTFLHEPARCIGCGLCKTACEKQGAIQMQPSQKYKQPYKGWRQLFTATVPRHFMSAFKVWMKYR